MARENTTTASAVESACGVQARSVLFVGANVRFLRSMIDVFESSGFDVHIAVTVADAQEACHRACFDLIILDWMVGRLFADELAMSLKSSVHPRSMPPVAVLTCIDEATTRSCFRPDSPIRDVLCKPTTPAEAVRWAQRLLDGEEVLKSKAASTH
jgi:DNA-binding response OmpR family regulator